MTTYKCTRCAGKGRLPQFGNVLGGVCFKCKGKATQATKPAKPSVSWAVFGQHRGTGQWLRMYNTKAPTAVKAIAKALKTYKKTSIGYQELYDLKPDTARAIKWSDMADSSATVWCDTNKPTTTP